MSYPLNDESMLLNFASRERELPVQLLVRGSSALGGNDERV